MCVCACVGLMYCIHTSTVYSKWSRFLDADVLYNSREDDIREWREAGQTQMESWNSETEKVLFVCVTTDTGSKWQFFNKEFKFESARLVQAYTNGILYKIR